MTYLILSESFDKFSKYGVIFLQKSSTPAYHKLLCAS